MPEEVLKSYMMNLKVDALKSEFRRLAKLIHPDKNKHPKASASFQKIHKVYEQAVERLESSKPVVVVMWDNGYKFYAYTHVYVIKLCLATISVSNVVMMGLFHAL